MIVMRSCPGSSCCQALRARVVINYADTHAYLPVLEACHGRHAGVRRVAATSFQLPLLLRPCPVVASPTPSVPVLSCLPSVAAVRWLTPGRVLPRLRAAFAFGCLCLALANIRVLDALWPRALISAGLSPPTAVYNAMTLMYILARLPQILANYRQVQLRAVLLAVLLGPVRRLVLV